MAGFDILTLVGEPWNDSAAVFRGIGVTVTDTASLPSSKFLEFVLNGASIYRVLKTGETIISNAAGTSLGGIKLAGSAGEMALTSQTDLTTSSPGEVLRYAWEDTAHVGNDPASGSVLQGMGAANFSIEGAATITHIAGNSTYAWAGMLGTRLLWAGYEAATANGKTIDFTNVGQSTRASPIVSVSAANVADDLIHFGLSDGTNWTVAAKVDAAGRGQFQMLDLPEQGAPGDPAAATARLYGRNVDGVTKVAFRDSSGAETVIGSTIFAAGGTVTASMPVANFTQTWNGSSVLFTGITANITDLQSRNTSKLLDLSVNSATVFEVRKTGEAVITSPDGLSLGGLKLAGSGGTMAITSQVDQNTGTPADVIRVGWEHADQVGSHPSSVAVIHGMGNNRLSIESLKTIVHIAGNSRYEWEGLIASRILMIGYETGSSTGKTIDFNNTGQTGTRATPLSASTIDPTVDIFEVCGYVQAGVEGGAWTTLARFDGIGVLYAPTVNVAAASGTAPGFTAKLTDDTQNRVSMGLDASDRGVITLGIGGDTAPDVTLARDVVAGSLRVSNATAPAQIRIYRTYADEGVNTEFWNMTWRIATTVPWASIRTAGAGSGVMRNMCIEPPLIGFGAPVGNGSNIPALKRVGAGLQVRLGDDSDFAAIRGKLTTADSAVPELVIPTMTLTLYDAGGTAYKVPCVPA
ncbi:MAG: hypothetical protein V4574_01395 [Pseudomonadota bacterium]